MGWGERGRPRRLSGRGRAGHLPALIWLSLVGLLASRARLRFTRRWEYSGHGGETEGGPRESRELSQRPGVIVVGEVKGRRCLG